MPDGSYAVLRASKSDLIELEKDYIKIRSDRWVKRPNKEKNIKDYLDLFTLGCYVIGRGPGLDLVEEIKFNKGYPIICINDSVKKIETLDITNPIFAFQQDRQLGTTCLPKDGYLIISTQSYNLFTDTSKLILFNPYTYGLNETTLSVVCILELLKRAKCKEVIMIGFDAITTGNCSYAKSIDFIDKKQNQSRFLNHAKLVEKYKQYLDLKFE